MCCWFICGFSFISHVNEIRFLPFSVWLLLLTYSWLQRKIGHLFFRVGYVKYLTVMTRWYLQRDWKRILIKKKKVINFVCQGAYYWTNSSEFSFYGKSQPIPVFFFSFLMEVSIPALVGIHLSGSYSVLSTKSSPAPWWQTTQRGKTFWAQVWEQWP